MEPIDEAGTLFGARDARRAEPPGELLQIGRRELDLLDGRRGGTAGEDLGPARARARRSSEGLAAVPRIWRSPVATERSASELAMRNSSSRAREIERGIGQRLEQDPCRWRSAARPSPVPSRRVSRSKLSPSSRPASRPCRIGDAEGREGDAEVPKVDGAAAPAARPGCRRPARPPRDRRSDSCAVASGRRGSKNARSKLSARTVSAMVSAGSRAKPTVAAVSSGTRVRRQGSVPATVSLSSVAVSGLRVDPESGAGPVELGLHLPDVAALVADGQTRHCPPRRVRRPAPRGGTCRRAGRPSAPRAASSRCVQIQPVELERQVTGIAPGRTRRRAGSADRRLPARTHSPARLPAGARWRPAGPAARSGRPLGGRAAAGRPV